MEGNEYLLKSKTLPFVENNGYLFCAANSKLVATFQFGFEINKLFYFTVRIMNVSFVTKDYYLRSKNASDTLE